MEGNRTWSDIIGLKSFVGQGSSPWLKVVTGILIA